MSAFDDLYQEIIMDHYRSPRGKARLDHIPQAMVHENPTCGDTIKLEVVVGDGGAGARAVRRARLRHQHRLRVADDRVRCRAFRGRGAGAGEHLHQGAARGDPRFRTWTRWETSRPSRALRVSRPGQMRDARLARFPGVTCRSRHRGTREPRN